MNRKIILRAAALVLFLAATAVGAFLLTQRPSKDEASVIAALEEAVIALRFPGSTVEEAAAELKTPENAAAFVRERVSETGYKGAIFTPEDVLRQRVGNRMDRARLLVALIEAQGGTAHIMADGRSAQRAFYCKSLRSWNGGAELHRPSCIDMWRSPKYRDQECGS